MNNTVIDKLYSEVRDDNLYVLVSHAHGDHFDKDVLKFSKLTDGVTYVLSEDIMRMYPSLEINKTTVIVQPGQTYNIDDIAIRTFESNDAGVAFLIEYRGKRIYYGGDLAKWDWPEWSENKRKEHVDVFEQTLDILSQENVDIAFSNMDERLDSWAGPVEFIEKAHPRYFVPMHTFGNLEWLDDLIAEKITSDTTIFKYEKQGETIKWDI